MDRMPLRRLLTSVIGQESVQICACDGCQFQSVLRLLGGLGASLPILSRDFFNIGNDWFLSRSMETTRKEAVQDCIQNNGPLPILESTVVSNLLAGLLDPDGLWVGLDVDAAEATGLK